VVPRTKLFFFPDLAGLCNPHAFPEETLGRCRRRTAACSPTLIPATLARLALPRGNLRRFGRSDQRFLPQHPAICFQGSSVGPPKRGTSFRFANLFKSRSRLCTVRALACSRALRARFSRASSAGISFRRFPCTRVLCIVSARFSHSAALYMRPPCVAQFQHNTVIDCQLLPAR
jgi:hypothetical protein